MTEAEVFALVFALAFITESMVEYFAGALADHIPALSGLRWALMYIAAGVGVGFSFAYSLDVISFLAGGAVTPAGMIVTGLGIGRGANWLHQFVSQFFPG